jgi:predicted glutamine amidotransferase
MCGLVFSHNRDGHAVNKQVLRQYHNQKQRGKDGYGVYDASRNFMVHETTEKRITKYVKRHPSNSLMFHHRMPTSTKNVKTACHPFSTGKQFGDTEYVLMHNGGIWNDISLYGDHYKNGIRYQSLLDDGSYNDSEALLWDFALYMEGQQAEMNAYGPMAFICMQLTNGKPTMLYFGHNDERPLKMKRTKSSLFLSSEGKGVPLPEDVLYSYDYETGELDTKLVEFKAWSTKPSQSYSPYDDEIERWEATAMTYPYASIPINGGDWLGDRLTRKFNVKPMQRSKKVINFVETASGVMIPEEQVIGVLDPPKADTIVMEYLISHKGVFETAYWALEGYYEEFEPMMANDERIAYERALNLLATNPEFEDENSVSSIWSSLWSKTSQQTLTV